jgi:sirohydrochlorin cobaltochelatase
MLRPTLLALSLALTPALAVAQGATTHSHSDPSPVGTIVIAHGGDSLWNALVVNAARAAKTGGPVEVSFLMGPGAKEGRFQDAVAKLEKQGAREIVVVPMLVSSHSGHYDQIRYLVGDSVQLDEVMMHHLHMGGIDRPKASSAKLRVTKAMDDSPQIARVLIDRARALAPDYRDRAVMIVGHGTNSS